MTKLRMSIYSFMRGRYGSDALNQFLLVIVFILLILNMFTLQNIVFNLLIELLMIYILFRSFSKNIYARQRENSFYLSKKRFVKRMYMLMVKQLKDNGHKYYLCPNCSQIVRVPKGRGNIEISCPHCREKFERKS